MCWNKLTRLIICRACVVVSGWPCLYCCLTSRWPNVKLSGSSQAPCSISKPKSYFWKFFHLGNEMGLKVANIVLPVFLLLFLKWIMQVDGNVPIKTRNEFFFLFFVCLLNCFDLYEEIKIWPFLFSRFLWTTFSWLLVWRTLLKMLVFSSLRPSAEFTSASASG